jgi:hypothetical protein
MKDDNPIEEEEPEEKESMNNDSLNQYLANKDNLCPD